MRKLDRPFIVQITHDLIPDLFQVSGVFEDASPFLSAPTGKQETEPFASPEVMELPRFWRTPRTATLGSWSDRGIVANYPPVFQ